MTPPSASHLFLLAALWTTYFALHSALASLSVKQAVARRRPELMPAYRLLYNAAALLLIVPPLVLMFRLQGPWLWSWSGPWGWLADSLALAAVMGVLWSLRYYQGGEFLGLRQWRTREREIMDQEDFHISPLHRFVRHPWYALSLVILWTRDMDAARLLSICLASAYFVIGSRLEEGKLMRYHGEKYRRYREQVPGLVPLPWRYLSPRQARELAGADPQQGQARR